MTTRKYFIRLPKKCPLEFKSCYATTETVHINLENSQFYSSQQDLIDLGHTLSYYSWKLKSDENKIISCEFLSPLVITAEVAFTAHQTSRPRLQEVYLFTIQCEQCSHLNDIHHKYCSQCGNKLTPSN